MNAAHTDRLAGGVSKARANAWLSVVTIVCCCHAGVAPAAGPDGAVALGLGSHYPPSRAGEHPAKPAFMGGELAGKAPPTNQWYSSIVFERPSHPIHAHPMTYRATDEGFEIGMPSKLLQVVDAIQRAIRYPHVAAITVIPLAFKPGVARLTRASDWLARISMAGGTGEALDATVLHGSPFSYFECSTGDVLMRLASKPASTAGAGAASADPRISAFTVAGKAYAVFAPAGATWEWRAPTELVLHLPAKARYFSVAGLPDQNEATLRDFLAVAYAFPTSTRVDWAYDDKTSTARSSFTVQTEAKEGTNLTTFMGLYPHHWNSVKPEHVSHYQYESIRGPIRIISGNSFSVEHIYHGIVPYWGELEDPDDKAAVDGLMGGDLAKADQLFSKQQGRGTYWIGKGLGATAQLMSVAEAEGRAKMRDALLGSLKDRYESWFQGRRGTYFVQDPDIGSFLGYPQEFESVRSMNDHHFHYGYWVMGAAHIALRDPDWVSPDKWGGMVGKIVADIATDERGRADFPFLRNFDPYEGHSWASGYASFDDGNNQESSSEAVNAWAGLILLGEATGNQRIRDLGIYMYTTEIASVQQYWFDFNQQVIAPDFGKPFASMVFGGRYAYNTWWTEEPREILGINAMPLTTASLYLGEDPAFVRKAFDALPGEAKAYVPPCGANCPPADIWQDVLSSYLALADPAAGLAMWNKNGTTESGETRSHTLFWLLSLKEMGTADFSVTADTPLYSVFKNKNGGHTYLAYNARNAPIHVTFSDGKGLDVPARSLARAH